MTKKTSLTSAAKKEDPTSLRVPKLPNETTEDAIAHTSLRPTVQAALTLREYNKDFGEVAVNTLVTDLVKQCELANNGDLSRAESILTAQAHTLDAIFNNLARRAALNAGEYSGTCETYLRLALKAQSQCRATLETLAAIKNPPIVYAKQANVTTGPQQINNGTAVPSQARGIKNEQSQLLRTDHGERMDGGTAGATIPSYSTVEAVGEINRAEIRRG